MSEADEENVKRINANNNLLLSKLQGKELAIYILCVGFSLEADGRQDLPSTSEFFTSYFSVLTWVNFSKNPYCFYPATLKVSENPDCTVCLLYL